MTQKFALNDFLAQPSRFCDVISAIPGVQTIIESIHQVADLSLVVYGGSVLDLLLGRKVSNDLDFLLEYRGHDLAGIKELFLQQVEHATKLVGAKVTVYKNDHIVVHSIPHGLPVDIHYPSTNILLGLFRSEYTITGIGYDCRKKQFLDPLDGISDLRKQRLHIHSPAYVISGPSAFPRLYRTALKLGVPLPAEVVSLIRTYSSMVSMHDGRTNMRVLYETLKIFSQQDSFQAIRGLLEHGLLRCMFPEISPLIELAGSNVPGRHSILDNMRIVEASYKPHQYSADEQRYLNEAIFSFDNVTRIGVLRFATLFIGLGFSYHAIQPDSPYERGVSGADRQKFVLTMEKNILGFMASRFKEHLETARYLGAFIELLPELAHSILPEYYPSQLDSKSTRYFDSVAYAVIERWKASAQSSSKKI